MTRTILSLIAAQANGHPAATAIAAPGRPPLSYGALCDFVSTSAAKLRGLGVARGSRVAMVIPNGPEAATAFLAVSQCATVAPLNPGYKENEFAFHFSDLDVGALLIPADPDSPGRHQASDAARKLGIAVIEMQMQAGAAGVFALPDASAVAGDVEPSDFALALHTAGTTGRSKQVLLTHANLCLSMDNTRASLALSAGDRCLNVMPLFHGHGLVAAVLTSLNSGASVCCAPGFIATRYFDWLDEWRPTWITAVPAMLQSILARAPEHRESIENLRLRFIRSGSSPLRAALWRELEETFGAPVIESYGLGETSTMVTSNPLPPGVRKAGSVGVPMGPDVAIMDAQGNLLASPQLGEVVVRGETVFGGYHNDPESNPSVFAHGWFHTGDLGHFDADGYLYIDGRLKEIVNRGGEKISAREVEEVLLDHPGVAEAAAFPMPDAQLGQVVGAVIVPRSAVSEKELRDFSAARLAEYKVPARIVMRAEIPKSAIGKVQRLKLADQLGLATAAAEPAVYEAPATDSEKRLAAIWQECLRVERVGRHDRFIDLGGDSILAAQIVERIHRDFGQEKIRLIDFFANPTVAILAASICGAHRARRSSLVEMARGEGDPFFCVPGAVGRVWGLRELAAHFRGHMPFCAFDALEADEVDAATFSIATVAAAYVAEMKQRQPRGPYDVGGACWGSLVAFEMAQQLLAAGDEVRTLALIDPNPLTPNGFEVGARRDFQRRVRRLSSAGGFSADFKERIALLWSVFRILERRLRAPLGLIRRSAGQRLADAETWRRIDRAGQVLRLKAADAYRASPYAGTLTMVLASQNRDGGNEIRRDDWQPMARDYREIIVEGEHMMWMREPGAGRLASALLDGIASARAGAPPSCAAAGTLLG